MKQIEIAERQVWVHQTTERPEWVIIQPVDDHDLQGLDEEVALLGNHSSTTFTLVAFRIRNWNVELSPWKAPAVFGREDFGEGASNTLCYVLDELVTRFKGNRYCLGGYSLAGLFALWSGYQTDVFSSIVGASPSVWFPKWIEYADRHQMKANRVYLSLGDKEPKARNPIMARVGECIERMHKLLDCEKMVEWNEGNHFKDNAIRTAKGLAWAIR
jgi:hypothetical protein